MAYEFLEQIRSGDTLATANRRQARSLQSAFARQQMAAGRLVWETPDILPWTAWLERQWSEYRERRLVNEAEDTAVLLSPAQEAALWEEVIRGGQVRALLQIPGTAEQARLAWDLVHRWMLPAPEEQEAGPDAAAFADWAVDYGRRCQQHGFMDRARLPAALSSVVEHADFPRPERLLLFGGVDAAPADARVVVALAQAGCPIVRLDHVPQANLSQDGTVVRAVFADAAAELAAATAWATGQLQEDPQRRVGIVIPDLAAQREVVERLLAENLTPGSPGPGESTAAERPFNLSMGRPLAQTGVIDVALLGLELCLSALPLGRLSGLLRSPYIGGAETECARRALLDLRLREAGDTRVSARRLVQRARERGADGEPAAHGCPRLADVLDGACPQGHRASPRQAPSAWADEFADLLSALGWPGERALDSAEYQAALAWQALLGELAGLDVLDTPLTADEALGRLRRLAAARLFQPESGEAPVQVLGLLEAEGCVFDSLWLAGMHDESWPPPPRLHPFLTPGSQRRAGIPQASPAGQLAFSRRITAALLEAAPRVVVSNPAKDGDRELRPSPLVVHLPLMEQELVSTGAPSYRQLIRESVRLESFDDNQAPALAEGAAVRGGARVLKLQAACPFRAYAELRLGARGLPPIPVGPDPQVRGALVHRALELLWAVLGGHQALQALDAGQRVAQAQAAAEPAVAEFQRRQPGLFPTRLAAGEVRRLTTSLDAWMQLELRRPAFTVAGTEIEREIEFGGLRLRTRIDRMDESPQGARTLIDYKTGTTTLSNWFGERPEEPQLPLYLLSESEPCSAIAYGQFRPGDMRFRGLGSGSDDATGIVPLAKAQAAKGFAGWSELAAHWRRVLTGLAADFRAGNAAVDPKKYPDTCRQCGLKPLCRVGESRRFAALPEEQPVEEGAA